MSRFHIKFEVEEEWTEIKVKKLASLTLDAWCEVKILEYNLLFLMTCLAIYH